MYVTYKHLALAALIYGVYRIGTQLVHEHWQIQKQTSFRLATLEASLREIVLEK